VTWLLAIPVALLAVELLFRAVGHVATEPLWWHDLATQRKELQMRRLARRGRLDVLVVGTSMMLFGVDPAAIARRLGVSCYNGSIYRGVPRVTEAWLHDFALPILRPRLVVIGLSPVEANDFSPLVGRYEEYRASRVFSASPLRRAQIALARRSYAIRFAPMAKLPKALARNVFRALRTPSAWRWHVPLDIPGKVGPLGEGLDMLDRSFKVMPRMGELVRGQVGPGYANAGEQSGAWARMPALCREHGAEVVFAAMPAPRSMLDGVFEGGHDAFLRERARLQRLADETGTRVIDVTEGIDDEAFFADQVHANRKGRDLFTARLADALSPIWSALAHDPRGHADGHGAGRDLAAHDGVRADDGSVADR
jgi:ketosteroid isomerase-like protein